MAPRRAPHAAPPLLGALLLAWLALGVGLREPSSNATSADAGGGTTARFLSSEDEAAWQGALVASATAGAGEALAVVCAPRRSSVFSLDPGGASFTYAPAKDAYSSSKGDVDLFTYRVVDAATGAPLSPEVHAVEVYVAPTNDAPVAADGLGRLVFNGRENVVAPNSVVDTTERASLGPPFALYAPLVGSDIDGDTLRYRIVTPPSNGTAQVVDGSTLYYVPDPGFQGLDELEYAVDDGLGGGKGNLGGNDPALEDVATAVVQVGGDAGVPYVLPARVASGEDEVVTGRLERVATLSSYLLPLLRYQVVLPPEFGTVALACEGREVTDPVTCDSGGGGYSSGWFVFTPPQDAAGEARFTFRVYVEGTDKVSPEADAVITVSPRNDAPVAVAARYEAPMTYGGPAGNASEDPTVRAGAGTLVLEATDVDSELVFATVVAPANATGGVLYTALAEGGGSLPDPTTAVAPGGSITVQLDPLGGGRFSSEVYYEAPEGRAGRPLGAVQWHAEDLAGAAGPAAVAEVTVRCALGFYAPPGVANQSEVPPYECTPCEPGSKLSVQDQDQCTPCEPGSFSEGAAEHCTVCGAGTYEPSAGSPACDACPPYASSEPGATSLSQCFCEPGAYGVEGAQCHQCPGDGRWTQCPVARMRWPFPAPGYWVEVPKPRRNWTAETQAVVHQCFPADACEGFDAADIAALEAEGALDGAMTLVRKGKTCAEGYRGFACSLCDRGHYRRNGYCVEYSSNAVFGLYILFSALVLIMPFGAAYTGRQFAAVFVGVSFLQTCGLVSRIDANWPSQGFLVHFRIFMLDLEVLTQHERWDDAKRDANDAFYDYLKLSVLLPLLLAPLLLLMATLIYLLHPKGRRERVRLLRFANKKAEEIRAQAAKDKEAAEKAENGEAPASPTDAKLRWRTKLKMVRQAVHTQHQSTALIDEQQAVRVPRSWRGVLLWAVLMWLLFWDLLQVNLGATLLQLFDCMESEVAPGTYWLRADPVTQCYVTGGRWAEQLPLVATGLFVFVFAHYPVVWGAIRANRHPDQPPKLWLRRIGLLYTKDVKQRPAAARYHHLISQAFRLLLTLLTIRSEVAFAVHPADADSSAMRQLLWLMVATGLHLMMLMKNPPFVARLNNTMLILSVLVEFGLLWMGLMALRTSNDSESVADTIDVLNSLFLLAGIILAGILIAMPMFLDPLWRFARSTKLIERTWMRAMKKHHDKAKKKRASKLWHKAKQGWKMVKAPPKLAVQGVKRKMGWHHAAASMGLLTRMTEANLKAMCNFITADAQTQARAMLGPISKGGGQHDPVLLSRVFRKLYLYRDARLRVAQIAHRELVMPLDGQLHHSTRLQTLAAMAVYGDKLLNRDAARVLELAHYYHKLPASMEDERWRYGVLLAWFISLAVDAEATRLASALKVDGRSDVASCIQNNYRAHRLRKDFIALTAAQVIIARRWRSKARRKANNRPIARLVRAGRAGLVMAAGAFFVQKSDFSLAEELARGRAGVGRLAGRIGELASHPAGHGHGPAHGEDDPFEPRDPFPLRRGLPPMGARSPHGTVRGGRPVRHHRELFRPHHPASYNAGTVISL